MLIQIPKLTKVQQAFGLYWGWLHEVGFELDKDAHPSWKGNTEKTLARIREIKATMTEEELKDFAEKTKHSPIKL